KSYQWTADEQMAGPFLHRLLHTIFYTNKRAVQETSIHDGTASLASAAVDLANKFMMNYVSPKVLVVGLGEIGQNVAENLKGTSAQVTLVNRSFEKTQKLADELSFESQRFEDLNALINNAHIVISAVQAETPIITSEMILESGVPRLFIDLSVPRSIDNSLEALPGVLLYNVDQLEEKTASALLKREAAVAEVQMILEKSIEEFNNWAQEMEVSPAIKKFKNALEEIRKEELSRYLEKADAEQIKLLEDATKSMMQRVIKLPVLQLKAACKRGEADQLVGLLNDLFNLEKEETKSSK
ncbi:MAG: glutamyl-tRNA reductase, partial [Marinoscillum sp.]